tara:strand:+ start:705 stop:905 length:201 start_codon:yes stop_codon:yes gene_type:complete
VIASGGTPIGGDIDFLTPWLRHFLSFLGIMDVEIVAAEGMMGVDGEEKIAAAAQAVEALVLDRLAA